MKKVIAAVILVVAALAGFFAYQGYEKSTQNNLYEEASVFFEEEDYKKAIQYFEEAREHDNLFSGSLEKEISYYQAEAHFNLGETGEAIAIYDAFIADNPKEAMNYTLKGYCLTTAGQYEEAAALYEAAYEKTGEGDFLVQLCNLYISMEKYEKAAAVCLKSSELKEETQIKTLRFLEIVIFEKQADYAKAYEKAAKFCEAYPEDEQGKKERDFLESRK